uniref:Uncharacterized protein n=1 Tax=Caenorhabditis japonica TaxID=281687 RepID=A0A8R1DYJ4_CAEJA
MVSKSILLFALALALTVTAAPVSEDDAASSSLAPVSSTLPSNSSSSPTPGAVTGSPSTSGAVTSGSVTGSSTDSTVYTTTDGANGISLLSVISLVLAFKL